jgi:hypothetical protein
VADFKGFNMKNLNLSFTTFLKLMNLNDEAKMREVQKYFSGSGYDFYKELRRGAKEISLGSSTKDDVYQRINSLSRKPERDNNMEGLEAFLKWLHKQRGDFTYPPHDIVKSQTEFVNIRISPEVFYRDTSNFGHIVYIWNTKTPKPSKGSIGAGLYLLKEFLAQGSYTNSSVYLLNLRENKVYDESIIKNTSQIIAYNNISALEDLWQRMND